MIRFLTEWWERPAKWWEFWYPSSGAGGGILMGIMIIIFGCLIGLVTYHL